MSEDWNNDQHNDHQHNNNDHYQGDQGYQQPEHQHFEPTHEPVAEAVHDPAPRNPSIADEVRTPVGTISSDSVRLDALEATINELRAGLDELKASLHPPVADVVPEPIVEPEPAVVVDPHADRLTAIEGEIAHVRTLLGAMAHSMAAIAADVTSHTDLHNETKSIIDEQHQLMRGLNYIITSAIGTLTASAKAVR